MFNYLIIINLLQFVFCIVLFFVQNGINIQANDLSINISEFGIYLMYSGLTLVIAIANLCCLISIRIKVRAYNRSRKLKPRNTGLVKSNKLLESNKPLEKNKAAAPNAHITLDSYPDETLYEADNITEKVQDANYEQLRRIFA